MKNKRSIIWKISKEELQLIIDKSNSIKEVMMTLGFHKNTGANRSTLYARMKHDNISREEIDKRAISLRHKTLGISREKRSRMYEEMFIENSNVNRGSVKRFIIKNNLIPYKCKNCPNEGIWNNKPISLQLEHINGINNDNRLSNLCFLCPNCHSQTSTFAGRGNKIVIENHCFICGEIIGTQSKYCRKHATHRKKKFEVTKEELKIMIDTMAMTSIGKKFGVSDNAIRRRAKVLGLI